MRREKTWVILTGRQDDRMREAGVEVVRGDRRRVFAYADRLREAGLYDEVEVVEAKPVGVVEARRVAEKEIAELKADLAAETEEDDRWNAPWGDA